MSWCARAWLAAVFVGQVACQEADEAAASGDEALEFRALPDARLPTSPNQIGPGPAFYGGVVTTTEPLAANIGRDILAQGGNAVDAAVAVQFMLNVVEPQSSGMGGGGFMLIHFAGAPPGETVVIDFRDVAPANVTIGMFDTSHSSAVKGSSGYAVGVPGTVKGMLYALEQYGSMSRATVLAPAIAAATNGFNISSRLAGDTGSSQLRLETTANTLNKGYYAEARGVFRPNGSSLSTGTLLRQPRLATTLQAIVARGATAFYSCADPSGIAAAIVETQTATRSGNSGGRGRMTCADLANYQLGVFDPDVANPDFNHAPVIGSYHGHTIVTAPPPSSGVFLMQMLDLLERLEASRGFSIGTGNYEFGEVGTLNIMQEVMRAAFADRARWLGDPDFFPVPVAGLLAPSYIQTRAGLITPGQRRSSFSAGSPPTVAAAQQKPASTKEDQEHEGVDTTHYTVIDEAGNVVSVTSTISDLWGTGLMVRGRGFMLNNQLPNFNDDPQGTAANPAANDVEGGKSPRTTIAPTLVFLGDELVAGYGSPGGTGIINAILQVTLNLIDHDLSLRTAVQRPRLSIDSGSSSADTEIESGFSASVRSSLQNMGYDFDSTSSIGAVQAIVTYPGGGQQYGAADTRRIGGVSGLDEH
ncbi:gamma-glutamyltransferase [Nannocystis sp. ILAH1]|uniref:gamma-glutamyltransferase n=1 Tax=Nannocystis sp. ILAH1 TaxID=2996789 RepID=UPI00227127B4|nr:gamma-glutamyltransferase [Nannocystis sp. ILAH1]MCY0994373.1 gamma-glutamyltransferase [Nannocystis sp. ILAH1]